MAAVTKRPAQFVGLHFFAPANIMKLLEIVRGKETSPETMATATALAKSLRKVGVVSGNAFGFIGNRMLFDYARQAIQLAEEGVAPERIDRAMKNFGMAMDRSRCSTSPGSTCSGTSSRAIQRDARPFGIIDRLYREKRYGQKAGAGIYRYEKGSREPIPIR